MSNKDIDFDKINNLMNTLRIKENTNIKIDEDTNKKMTKSRGAGDIRIGQSSSWTTTYSPSTHNAIIIEGNGNESLHQLNLYGAKKALWINSSTESRSTDDEAFVDFRSNNERRFAVYNSGEVTIGEVKDYNLEFNPEYLLHVRNVSGKDDSIVNIESNAGYTGIELNNLSNANVARTKFSMLRAQNRDRVDFIFGSPTLYDNNFMSINSLGHIGINTKTPHAHLEIEASKPEILLHSDFAAISLQTGQLTEDNTYNTSNFIYFVQNLIAGSEDNLGQRMTVDWRIGKENDGMFHIYGKNQPDKDDDTTFIESKFSFHNKGSLRINRIHDSQIPTWSSFSSGTAMDNYYLTLGGDSNQANGYRLIGFGYTNGTTSRNPPAYIGFHTKGVGSTGEEKGDLVFGTRYDYDSSTIKNPRFTIKSDGHTILNGTHGLALTRTPRNQIPTLTTVVSTAYQGYYLLLGRTEYKTDGVRLIGFGYNGQISTHYKHPPAYIGFKSTSTSNGTIGDLIFGNRSAGDETTASSYSDRVMVIKSSGNVGIGTENPDKKLDVDGDIKCDNIYLPETGKIYKNDVEWTGSGGSSNLWTQTSDDIYYDTGNVGIGTTTPGTSLHVKSSAASSTPIATFENDTGKNCVRIKGDNEVFLELWNTNSTTGDDTKCWGIGTNGDSSLNFNWKDNGSMDKLNYYSGSATMKLTKHGNLVLGSELNQTNIKGRFHINGSDISTDLEGRNCLYITGGRSGNTQISLVDHEYGMHIKTNTSGSDKYIVNFINESNNGLMVRSDSKVGINIAQNDIDEQLIVGGNVKATGNLMATELVLNTNTLTSDSINTLNSNNSLWSEAYNLILTKKARIRVDDGEDNTFDIIGDINGNNPSAINSALTNRDWSRIRFEFSRANGNIIRSNKGGGNAEVQSFASKNDLSIYSGTEEIVKFKDYQIEFKKQIINFNIKRNNSITFKKNLYTSSADDTATQIKLNYNLLKDISDNISALQSTSDVVGSPFLQDQTTTTTGNFFMYNPENNILKLTTNKTQNEFTSKIQFYSTNFGGEVGKMELNSGTFTVQAGPDTGNNGKIKLNVNNTTGLEIDHQGNMTIAKNLKFLESSLKFNIKNTFSLKNFDDTKTYAKFIPTTNEHKDRMDLYGDLRIRKSPDNRSGCLIIYDSILPGTGQTLPDDHVPLDWLSNEKNSIWTHRQGDNFIRISGNEKKMGIGIDDDGIFIRSGIPSSTSTDENSVHNPITFGFTQETWDSTTTSIDDFDDGIPYTFEYEERNLASETTIPKFKIDTDSSVFYTDLNVQGVLTHLGITQTNSPLTTSNTFVGSTSMASSLTVEGEINANNDLNVEGEINVNGVINANGNFTANQNVEIIGTLDSQDINVNSILQTNFGTPINPINLIPNTTKIIGSSITLKNEALSTSGLEEFLDLNVSTKTIDISSTEGIIFNEYSSVRNEGNTDYTLTPIDDIYTEIKKQSITTKNLSGTQLTLNETTIQEVDLQKLKNAPENDKILSTDNGEWVNIKLKINENLKSESLPSDWVIGLDDFKSGVNESINSINTTMNTVLDIDALKQISFNPGDDKLVINNTDSYIDNIDLNCNVLSLINDNSPDGHAQLTIGTPTSYADVNNPVENLNFNNKQLYYIGNDPIPSNYINFSTTDDLLDPSVSFKVEKSIDHEIVLNRTIDTGDPNVISYNFGALKISDSDFVLSAMEKKPDLTDIPIPFRINNNNDNNSGDVFNVIQDRIGINKDPQVDYKFDVNGNTYIDGDIRFTGDIYKNGELFSNTLQIPPVLWEESITDIYTKNGFNGNVGIGINAPTEKLHVIGNIQTNSLKLKVGTGEISELTQEKLSNMIALNDSWKTNSSNMAYNNENIGIGSIFDSNTNAPLTLLHLADNTSSEEVDEVMFIMQRMRSFKKDENDLVNTVLSPEIRFCNSIQGYIPNADITGFQYKRPALSLKIREQTNNNSDDENCKFILDSDGRLGLGGDPRWNNQLYINNTLDSGTSTVLIKDIIHNHSKITIKGKVGEGDSDERTTSIFLERGNGSNDDIFNNSVIMQLNDTGFEIREQNNIFFSTNQNGLVGINKRAEQSSPFQGLDVNGGIISSGDITAENLSINNVSLNSINNSISFVNDNSLIRINMPPVEFYEGASTRAGLDVSGNIFLNGAIKFVDNNFNEPLLKLKHTTGNATAWNNVPDVGDYAGSHTPYDFFHMEGAGILEEINSVSFGMSIGAYWSGENWSADNLDYISPCGKVNFKVNGFSSIIGNPSDSPNEYGLVPDKTILTLMGNGMVGINTEQPSLEGPGLEVIGDIVSTKLFINQELSVKSSGETMLTISNKSMYFPLDDSEITFENHAGNTVSTKITNSSMEASSITATQLNATSFNTTNINVDTLTVDNMTVNNSFAKGVAECETLTITDTLTLNGNLSIFDVSETDSKEVIRLSSDTHSWIAINDSYFGIGTNAPTHKMSVVLHDNWASRNDNGIVLSNMREELQVVKIGCANDGDKTYSSGYIALYDTQHEDFDFDDETQEFNIGKNNNVYLSAQDNQMCYINNNLIIGNKTDIFTTTNAGDKTLTVDGEVEIKDDIYITGKIYTRDTTEDEYIEFEGGGIGEHEHSPGPGVGDDGETHTHPFTHDHNSEYLSISDYDWTKYPTSGSIYYNGNIGIGMVNDNTETSKLLVNGDIKASGSALISNTLLVNDTSSFGKTIDIVSGGINITSGSLDIADGGATIAGNVDINGTANINSLNIINDVNVNQNLVVEGTITTTGVAAFNTNVNINGTLTAGYLVGDGSAITNLDSELSKLTDVKIVNDQGVVASLNDQVLTYEDGGWTSKNIEENTTFTNYLTNNYNARIMNTQTDWIYFKTDIKKLEFTDNFNTDINVMIENKINENGVWTQKTNDTLGTQYYVSDVRIGINKDDPIYQLDIDGSIRITGEFRIGDIELSPEILEYLQYLDGDLMEKLEPLTPEQIDQEPTLTSPRLITSGGVALALNLKQNNLNVVPGNGILIDNINGIISSTTFQKNDDFVWCNDNVGIGRNNPDEKLVVQGNIKAETLILGNQILQESMISHLSNINSNIQSQIDGKQITIQNTSTDWIFFETSTQKLIFTDTFNTYIEDEIENSIINGLEISNINGLQERFNLYQPRIGSNDLEMSTIIGLEDKFNQYQLTIGQNDLNISDVENLVETLETLTEASERITDPYTITNTLDASHIGNSTINNTELDRLQGVTSNIQQQLDDKQFIINEENLLNPKYIAFSGEERINGTRATTQAITGNEFGFLSGLQGNIQSQINEKAPINNAVFTGTTFCEHPDSNNNYGTNKKIATVGYVSHLTNSINDIGQENATSIATHFSLITQNQSGIHRQGNRIGNIEQDLIPTIQSQLIAASSSRENTTSALQDNTTTIDDLSHNFWDVSQNFNDLSNDYNDKKEIITTLTEAVDEVLLPTIRAYNERQSFPPTIGSNADQAMSGDTRVITNQEIQDIANIKARTPFPGFGTSSTTALRGDTNLFNGIYNSLTGIPDDIATEESVVEIINRERPSDTNFPGFGNQAGKCLDKTFGDALYLSRTIEEDIVDNTDTISQNANTIRTNTQDITRLNGRINTLAGSNEAFDTLTEIVNLMGTGDVGVTITHELNLLKGTVNQTHNENLSSNTSRIDTLEDQKSTLTTNFTSLNEGYNALDDYVRTGYVETNIVANRTKSQGNETDIIQLTSELGTEKNKISELESNDSTRAQAITDLQNNKMDSIIVDEYPVENSEGIVKSKGLFERLAEKQPIINDNDLAISQINDLSSQLETINESLAEKQPTINNNDLSISQINDLGSQLGTINASLAQKQPTITDNDLEISHITGLDERLVQIETFDSGLTDDERANLNSISTISDKVDANELTLTNLTSQIDTLQTLYNSLEQQFSNSEAFDTITSALTAISDKEQIYENAKIQYGEFPYHGAAVAGDIDLITNFNTNGIDVNILDDEGQTPLHKACSYSDLSTVQTLLSFNDVNINAQDKQGATPIMLATTNNQSDIVTYLISGAVSEIDLTIKKYDGNDILLYIFNQEISPWSDLINLYNQQNTLNGRVKNAKEKMLKMDRSNISEKDMKSLLDINMHLIDIIQNNLNL